MPQIDQISAIFASQLFWLTITFGLIFLIVGLGMVPKIQGTVDLRDAQIAADLAAASEVRQSADQLEDQYRAALDSSRADANRLASEAKAQAALAKEARVRAADEAAAVRLQEASQRIAEARESVRAEIESVAADATVAMVQRVAGLTVDPALARNVVQQELVRG